MTKHEISFSTFLSKLSNCEQTFFIRYVDDSNITWYHLSLMLNPSSTLPLDFTDNDYGCVDSLSGAISFTTRPLLPSPASLFCACVHACARDRLACALPYIVVVPLGFTEKHMWNCICILLTDKTTAAAAPQSDSHTLDVPRCAAFMLWWC